MRYVPGQIAHLSHRFEYRCDVVDVDPAAQNIHDTVQTLGMRFEESAEAEFLRIKCIHELSNGFHSGNKLVAPSAELLRREIVCFERLMNRVSRHLTRFERQEHTGGIYGIQKPVCIANQHPAFSGNRTGPIREVTGHFHGEHLLCPFQPFFHRPALLQFFLENHLRGSASVLKQMVDIPNHADANHVVGQRNVPEPGVFRAGVQDQRCPLVDPLVSISASKMCKQGCLPQCGLFRLDPQFAGNQRAAPRGIHYHARRHVSHAAVEGFCQNPRGAVAREMHLVHGRAKLHVRPFLPGIVQHHPVELASQHLPRDRTLVGIVFMKIERRRSPARTTEKLYAVFPHKRAVPQLIQHAQPLERPVGSGHQRLADLKPGKLRSLEQQHTVAVLRHQSRGRTPRRPAPDHNNVVMIRRHITIPRELNLDGP